MGWEDNLPSIATAAPPEAPSGANWEDAMPSAMGPASNAPPEAPVARKPTFGNEDYIKLIAAKHKVDPDYVKGIVNSQTQGEALKGVPVAGALVDKAGAYAAAAAHGVTGAGASGDTLAERATKNLALNQEIAEDFTREHPVLSGTSNAIGGLLATAPLASTTLGAKLLGLTAKSLPKAALATSASGAVVGAADSAARGGSPVTGALLGGLTGIAAPVIGRGLGAAWEAFQPTVSSVAKLPGRALEATGLRAATPAAPEIAEVPSAGQAILHAASDDGMNEGNIEAEYKKLGPLGMPADLGPNLQTQVEAIASTRGPGQGLVKQRLQARDDGAPARMNSVINSTLGTPVDPEDLKAGLTAIQQHDATPLYQQVHAATIEQTPALTEALARNATRIAFQKASKIASNRGVDPATNQMATLDYTKQALDDMYSVAQRAGRNNEAASILDAQHALVGELDKQVPLYAQARNAYAGPAKIKDAVDAGGDLFKKTVRPGQVESTVAGMTDSEKSAYLASARASLGDAMSQSGNPAMAAQKLLANGWNKQKIASVIGPNDAQTLFDHMALESKFHQTYLGAFKDPRTAARISAQKEFPSEFEEPKAPDFDVTLMGLATGAAKKVYSTGVSAYQRAQAVAKSGAAAKALTAQGTEGEGIVSAIAKHPATQAVMQERRRQFAHVSAFGSTVPQAALAASQPGAPGPSATAPQAP